MNLKDIFLNTGWNGLDSIMFYRVFTAVGEEKEEYTKELLSLILELIQGNENFEYMEEIYAIWHRYSCPMDNSIVEALRSCINPRTFDLKPLKVKKYLLGFIRGAKVNVQKERLYKIAKQNPQLVAVILPMLPMHQAKELAEKNSDPAVAVVWNQMKKEKKE